VPLSIDHVVIAVNDLAQTTHDYQTLGFTVTIGGDHAHRGSHNSLITFQDGSYIELIAFKHEPPVKDNNWWDLLQTGEGLVDFALVSADLIAETGQLQARGFEITGPLEGGRLRPDSIRIAWRVARLNTTGPNHLPFLIDDITDRELRVPGGEAAVHANGVTGISGISVGVASLEQAATTYRDLLGEPTSAPGDDHRRRFVAGTQYIDLVEPGPDSPELGGAIARRGSGPYRLALRGPSADELPIELTHAAQVVIE
jgi:catechol 2,3-dioxygenase-like lactoylglutathione lyase family enzyme